MVFNNIDIIVVYFFLFNQKFQSLTKANISIQKWLYIFQNRMAWYVFDYLREQRIFLFLFFTN